MPEECIIVLAVEVYVLDEFIIFIKVLITICIVMAFDIYCVLKFSEVIEFEEVGDGTANEVNALIICKIDACVLCLTEESACLFVYCFEIVRGNQIFAVVDLRSEEIRIIFWWFVCTCVA